MLSFSESVHRFMRNQAPCMATIFSQMTSVHIPFSLCLQEHCSQSSLVEDLLRLSQKGFNVLPLAHVLLPESSFYSWEGLSLLGEPLVIVTTGISRSMQQNVYSTPAEIPYRRVKETGPFFPALTFECVWHSPPSVATWLTRSWKFCLQKDAQGSSSPHLI